MTQDTQQAGPIGALRGASVSQQGQATAGVGQSRSEKFFSVSGLVWASLPTHTQVPGPLLSSGGLSLSTWALIRSCPQEKGA